jgi:hypothetical protein
MPQFDERVDCTMCTHWSMIGCRVRDQHFPHDGHNCPRFDLDYTIEVDEYLNTNPESDA